MWRDKLHIRPAAALLLTAFALLAQPLMLAAVLLAVACHEAGHLVVLRLVKGNVKEIYMTAFGAEIRFSGRIGYGAELLVTVAGPAVNLLMGALFSILGDHGAFWYLFSGTQAVLGIFNLLPVRPLDGERILWVVTALLSDPYFADKLCAWAGLAVSLAATVLALVVFCRLGGTPFFLWASLGLLWNALGEMGLVNRGEKG